VTMSSFLHVFQNLDQKHAPCANADNAHHLLADRSKAVNATLDHRAFYRWVAVGLAVLGVCGLLITIAMI
jgi:hypothetical protein